jgi:hypothetical protein
MSVAVGIHRKPLLSPGPHRENDEAIMDGSLAALERLGWSVKSFDETRVEAGEALPPADLYLNMCQGAEGNRRLLAAERRGVRFVNRPSSALACHRVPLVQTLSSCDVTFAPSYVFHRNTDRAALDAWLASSAATDLLWIKRGDVHSEGPGDVRSVPRNELGSMIEAFFRRGIDSVVVQHHIEGPLVKFYGIGDGAWFRWFEPVSDSMPPPAANAGSAPKLAIDEAALRSAAFGAAARLRLEVFGGDAIFAAPNRPVLIDVNDWPSFARFRQDAADTIASYVHGVNANELASHKRTTAHEPRETP